MISRVKQALSEKLKNISYRHRFFKSRVQDEIATQILLLRERRNFRQIDLAKRCSMKQTAISRIEKADYASWNFQTLLRIAEGLDARLRVVFEPAENVIKDYERKEKGTRSFQEFSIDFSQHALFRTIPSSFYANVTNRGEIIIGNTLDIRGVHITGMATWPNIADKASTSRTLVPIPEEQNDLLIVRP